MKKDQYVVGYSGAGNVVYGKRYFGVTFNCEGCINDVAHPMTESQAKRALKKLACKGGRIFKLVEV